MFDEAQQTVKSALKAVKGVAVTFDLWMSNKTDDIIYLDVYYIDHD